MIRHFALFAVLLCVVGCAGAAKQRPPFNSQHGFMFRVFDGTGTYDSESTLYTPQLCGTTYKPVQIELEQETFSAIEDLVEAGALWDTRVGRIPGCADIDVAIPGHSYYFQAGEKSVSIEIGRCEAADARATPYLNAIRRMIRQQSDRYKIQAPTCIHF